MTKVNPCQDLEGLEKFEAETYTLSAVELFVLLLILSELKGNRCKCLDTKLRIASKAIEIQVHVCFISCKFLNSDGLLSGIRWGSEEVIRTYLRVRDTNSNQINLPHP